MSYIRVPKSKKTTNNLSPRTKNVKLKTKKGRKISSSRWLERQLNDPYVQAAKSQNLRSRAAFKIREIQEKFNLFKTGQKIVDLGAAPGGWSQEIASFVQSKPDNLKVFALDIAEMQPIAGVHFLQQDFLEPEAGQKLIDIIGDKVDGVVSDMAPFTTGHQNTDHLRIIALVEAAYGFAKTIIKEDGFFVCKVFQGGTEKTIYDDMLNNFKKVRHFKPPSSRKESPEVFVIAQGFTGKRD